MERWTDKNRPPLLLAPMAGVTDSAFRIICGEMGADVTYTEMVSMKALSFGDKKTKQIMAIDPREKRTVVQIFGSERDIMAQGAEQVSQMGCVAIDINMGCPAPKIVNNGEGCSLMKDLPKAAGIIQAVAQKSKVPVTVKFRKGMDDDHICGVEFAKMAEASGAAAVCIHGRTREQYYAPSCDVDYIGKVKAAVKIPVIGNGDITSPESAKAMLDRTGCDALMIGRAAMGNPFLFREVARFLETGEKLPAPTVEERIAVAQRHMELMLEKKGEKLAMLEARKHMAWYFKGMKHSNKIKLKANTLTHAQDLYDLLDMARELYLG